jgi:carbohydrate kinase (thermoresistant glucokinase family)
MLADFCMSASALPNARSDTNPHPPVRVYLLMGVSGCGKTAVGERLAGMLGATFVDSDALHPPENVAKMSAKIPLTDEDRWPWMQRIRREVIDATPPGRITILACSALKRAYRSLLMDGVSDIRLIYLRGTFELIASRLAARKGHFMPPDLLRSQFATLEEPSAAEGLTVDIGGTVEEVAAECAKGAADWESRRLPPPGVPPAMPA